MDVPSETLPVNPAPLSSAHRAVREVAFGSLNGQMAGMTSRLFDYPLDLTKVRLQSQVLDGSARFNGPLDCMRQTWKNEGDLFFSEGSSRSMFGAMFNCATLFLTYREAQSLLKTLTGTPENQKLPVPQLAAAAAAAGAVTSLVLTPVELVKCKMQVQSLVTPAATTTLPGPISILKSIIRTSGLKGLWVGQSGTFIRETGGAVTWFGTKEFVGSLLIARRLGSKPSDSQNPPKLLPWESAVSGACSGVTFNFLLFPVDSVKSAMQTEDELRPKGAVNSVPLSPAYRAMREITFGSIAGMASKIFEHPFDLTKVRLQAQVLDTSARFSGPLDCMRQTWKNEGIPGLYRGLPAPVFGAMLENATLFLSYREAQNVIKSFTGTSENQKLPFSQLAVAAAAAGAVTSLVLTPVELVKCKMQVQTLVTPAPSAATNTPPGPLSVLTSIIRTSGVRGLWVGQSGTFIRETGGSAAWFGTKEYVGSLLIARRLGSKPSDSQNPPKLLPWESAVSGACSGITFNLAFFPADTVKSAMQTEDELRPKGPGAPKTRSTFFGTLVQMYKAQGPRGLYAGCGITIARSTVSSGMIFLIYDELDRIFS
ncbi:hypothetical protein D9758_005785 [Tetrapyrgos nigripes]|uniref:Mitochondrial carrier n=1 Tax=Tetrapyrgos nigripes TaxID=182062 RepID=A0A8H5LQY3_9AGAR|nr:hypothetical protein D9758_005785 [Tetrapyrgos nigripes]